jgi:predicted nucleic acid-binding protein
MADTGRNERYLALDTNVLVPFIISDAPDHEQLRFLSDFAHVINPTVIHEAYHTLVFKLGIDPEETATRLEEYMDLSVFIPIDAHSCKNALRIAVDYKLGGRDSLILSSYSSSKRFYPRLSGNLTFLTFDREILKIEKLFEGGSVLLIKNPIAVTG